MHFRPFASVLFLLSALPAVPRAEDGEGWNPDTTFPALSPEEAIKTIEVPKGYHLECVASEPMVEEPASFAFDPDGALYVCEWRTYMQDEEATDQLAPVSRVVKLVDTDGDGRMDRRTVFIDNVVLPRTVLPLGDRVLVNLTGSNSVYAYFDDNGDGVSDRRELAFESSPNGGNIEHQNSGLIWNLDNTVCANDYRFQYREGKLEPGRHSVGRISQWGLARDDDGRLFCTWAGGANPAHSFQLPAGYPILKVEEHAPGYRIPYASCKVWDQSSGGYHYDQQRILRDFSACCGQTVLRSALLKEFHGNVVTCEPVGRLIRMSTIGWTNGLGVARNTFPGTEFIRSTDAYFRPVWSENGPDGCLYFSDLYRGIIQEKAWFPTKDTDNRKDWVARYHRVKKWGMLRVVRHGRIYRLVPDDRRPGPAPRLLSAPVAELVGHLASPHGWWRDTAQMLLVSRQAKEAVPALKALASTHPGANARIHALWTLDGLDALEASLIRSQLQHAHPRVRRAAVQLAEKHLGRVETGLLPEVERLAADPDAQVRAQAYLALRPRDAVPEALLAQPEANPLVAALQALEKSQAQEAAVGKSAKDGKVIYETLCTTCHGPDGKGVKLGDKMLAPPLTQSEWFKRGGDVETLARILLKGQTGPVDGIHYGEGSMLALEAAYNDEQLASVMNFIGERWHGWKKPAEASAISKVRAELTTRITPWTQRELQDEAKKRKKRP